MKLRRAKITLYVIPNWSWVILTWMWTYELFDWFYSKSRVHSLCANRSYRWRRTEALIYYSSETSLQGTNCLFRCTDQNSIYWKWVVSSLSLLCLESYSNNYIPASTCLIATLFLTYNPKLLCPVHPIFSLYVLYTFHYCKNTWNCKALHRTPFYLFLSDYIRWIYRGTFWRRPRWLRHRWHRIQF